MARSIEVSLEADTSDFERGMKSSASAVDRLESELKSADSGASRLQGGLDKTTDRLEGATGAFRGVNDLAGGLGDTLGIEGLSSVTMYATGIADMADGMAVLLKPAIEKAIAAFTAMNATLLANPIVLVVAAIAALGVAFVVAYKKSETFRNIVNGAFDAVKDGALAFVDVIKSAVTDAAQVIGKVADIITAPYRIAFKAIAAMWNATLGGFGISIPGFSIPFGPSFGGLSFTIPNIPTFRAAGGPLNAGQAAIVGERGPELFVPSGAGTVMPAGSFGGSEIVVRPAAGAGDKLIEILRFEVNKRGGNVQTVLGRA